ncbi:hypothetical protein VTO73DRAFT_11347 [Trametes versicolor]
MDDPVEDVIPKRPTIFLSNKLLRAAGDAQQENLPVKRAAADDVESFYWVLLYVVYRNSLAIPEASDESEEARSLLDDEFSKLFSARDVGTLVTRRYLAFDPDLYGDESYAGIDVLLDHLYQHEPRRTLRRLVAGIWQKLRLCPFKEAQLHDKYADLDKEVAEVNHRFNKQLEARGLPARYHTATVPGNARRYTANHHHLIIPLKNLIDKREADRAS